MDGHYLVPREGEETIMFYPRPAANAVGQGKLSRHQS
jgi:hypothetical protein